MLIVQTQASEDGNAGQSDLTIWDGMQVFRAAGVPVDAAFEQALTASGSDSFTCALTGCQFQCKDTVSSHQVEVSRVSDIPETGLRAALRLLCERAPAAQHEVLQDLKELQEAAKSMPKNRPDEVVTLTKACRRLFNFRKSWQQEPGEPDSLPV